MHHPRAPSINPLPFPIRKLQIMSRIEGKPIRALDLRQSIDNNNVSQMFDFWSRNVLNYEGQRWKTNHVGMR